VSSPGERSQNYVSVSFSTPKGIPHISTLALLVSMIAGIAPAKSFSTPKGIPHISTPSASPTLPPTLALVSVPRRAFLIFPRIGQEGVKFQLDRFSTPKGIPHISTTRLPSARPPSFRTVSVPRRAFLIFPLNLGVRLRQLRSCFSTPKGIPHISTNHGDSQWDSRSDVSVP